MAINLKVNKKLQKFLTTHKPIKVAYGGRGSGKSIGFGDMLTLEMYTKAYDILCLREFQDSIQDSVHRVFKSSIEERLGLDGWDIQQRTIIAPNGASTRYMGAAKNPDSIQSAQDYRRSWFEEAHRASETSLDKLIPTILRVEDAECWFSLNPQSSEDPASKRLILPFIDQVEANGYYEDDMHLIVKLNWRDNPWWNDAAEAIRRHDYETMPRAKYDWIWEGAFNDSVEDALIISEWFDACVDAHKKLGFEAQGEKIAAHDPSDTGPDNKGFAMRHGSVVLDVQEKETGDINEGGDWALGLAIKHQVDSYTWDCDGMGVGLNRQTSAALDGKGIRVAQFKGSESPDNANAVYDDPTHSDIANKKLTKDVFTNKRAQYYFELRDRVYRTYEAVTKGKYHDPDTLISFDSSIPHLRKLRSELCRIPIKPNANGKLALYTKDEMKRKYRIASPNLADCVMMCMRNHKKTLSVSISGGSLW